MAELTVSESAFYYSYDMQNGRTMTAQPISSGMFGLLHLLATAVVTTSTTPQDLVDTTFILRMRLLCRLWKCKGPMIGKLHPLLLTGIEGSTSVANSTPRS